LILIGTYPFASQGWDDIDRHPAELRARSLAELGEDYAPSTEQLARMQEFGRAVRSVWGSGAALRIGLPSVRSTRQLALAVLPGAIEALSGWLFKPPLLGRGGGI
jgi:hypothetical protein